MLVSDGDDVTRTLGLAIPKHVNLAPCITCSLTQSESRWDRFGVAHPTRIISHIDPVIIVTDSSVKMRRDSRGKGHEV